MRGERGFGHNSELIKDVYPSIKAGLRNTESIADIRTTPSSFPKFECAILEVSTDTTIAHGFDSDDGSTKGN